MGFLPFGTGNKLVKNESNSGQALLIVLLALSVALTLVLSVVARSVTDVKITTYQEDSVRAFSAAEAGLEQTLISGSSFASPQLVDSATNTTFTSHVTSIVPTTDVANRSEFIYPSSLSSGETATIWYVSHDAYGKLSCSPDGCYSGNGSGNAGIFRLCWGKNPDASYTPYRPGVSEGTRPAVELTVYYDWDTATQTTGRAVGASHDFSYVKVVRRAYDPEPATGRLAVNNFTQAETANCTVSGIRYTYLVRQINFFNNLGIPQSCTDAQGCLLFAKVRMLYNTTEEPIAYAAQGPDLLPPQGVRIESTGAAGETQRKVQLLKSYPELPYVFDSVIFSKGDLVK